MMYKHCLKRLFDFLMSLGALICLSPLLLVTTIWLHFANKGAGAFFFQSRLGKNAKIFKVIKFKTMTDERGIDGDLLPDEQRLTKVGEFMRSTSLDELPQLLNVLKGDMALIGPRPLMPHYFDYLTKREKLRFTVRSGITGWAQINGRNNVTWDEKLEMDVYYVEHLTLWMDIRIFFTTIKKVITREDVAVSKENELDIERQNKQQL